MDTTTSPTVTADVWLPEHDQPIPFALTLEGSSIILELDALQAVAS